MDLKDKVIWITGASSGIGEALAYQLAKEGCRLVLSSRNKDTLEKVRQYSGIAEERGMVLPLDLAASENFPELAWQVIKRFGRIDVLVNNGGVSQRAFFRETEMEVARRIMEINFFGNIALTKAVLPFMVKQKGGSIVAVTSVVGKYGTPKRSIYSASKHALHGFYDALRAEHWNDHLHVLLVGPGYIKTSLSYNALKGDGSEQGTLDTGQKNGMSPEECARKMIHALKKKKREIYPGGLKERAGVYLKRFLPGLFSKIVRKVNVT
ncbi:SDR family oxidoreductase [Rapidithrix thailandica]|uniref:SDR family oxidoreductase n=1 Tax=Rapidithrix thailandica TaxID=413964 RepID=A0AAW9S517_9BACT